MTNTNQPFMFGSGGQGGTLGGQGSTPFAFGTGAGAGAPAGAGGAKTFTGMSAPTGFGGTTPMGHQSGQSSVGTMPSLFGQQPTLGQNQPAAGAAPPAQGPPLFGQGTGMFGSTTSQNTGAPAGGTKIFPQPQGGTMGQGTSLFQTPTQSGASSTLQSSLGQSSTTQPQGLNMFSQLQSTPANPQSSISAAPKFNLVSQSSGQPQSFPIPSQIQGMMQLGAGSQVQATPGTTGFTLGTMPSTTKSGMQMGLGSSIPQPQPFFTPQSQPMMAQHPTLIPQSQAFSLQQKQTPPQPFQTSQPTNLGQINLTPQKPTMISPALPSQLPHMGQMGGGMGQTGQMGGGMGQTGQMGGGMGQTGQMGGGMGQTGQIGGGMGQTGQIGGLLTPQAQSMMASVVATNTQAQSQLLTTPQKQPLMASSQAAQSATSSAQSASQFITPQKQTILPSLSQPQLTASQNQPSQTSGQLAIFQLQASPSTALPTATPPTTTSTSLSAPSSQPTTSSTVPFSYAQLPQTQVKQPLTTAVTTSLPIVSASTSGSVTQAPAKKYTYRQLEDVINQWVLELGEQQKVFVNQAKQINAWDVALLENEESIISLHNEVERAKSDQDRLNHDLDSILVQQSELEEMLQPLEGFLANQTAHASAQHADQERNKTYSMAERIDTSMKDMMQNLREVMERINTANSANYDRNNPISQITGILNAHMDSLLFIDDNTNALQQKVDELSKKLDSKKQDQETKLKTAFN